MSKILQLSVLDAVLHPRMYYKYALSFAEMGHQVKVIGEKKHNIFSPEKNIEILALPPIAPSAFARLRRQGHLWRIAWADKPDILMIHAIELTFFAFLYKKIRPHTYVIYDVFEDYEKNLFYNPLLANWKKKMLKIILRPLERFFAQYFDAVCYAENCYDNILNIPDEKKYVFLNKFSPKILKEPKKISLPAEPYMLYTGTLEENWGVLQTIEIWIGFNQIRPLHLVMAGFTYDSKMLAHIEQKVAESGLKHLFTLYGGNEYVSYADITYLIQNSQFGTGLYLPTPSIVGKIPTKFFEYMYLGKPLLFTSEPYWNELNERWKFGISVGENISYSELLFQINIYKPAIYKQEASWENYKMALTKLTNHV